MRTVFKVMVLALVFTGLSTAVFAQSVDLTSEEGWYTYDDRAGNGGSSVSKVAIEEEKIDGKSVKTATMTGSVTTKFQYGFAGFGVKPSEEAMAKIKKAKGIKFKYMGDGQKYRFRVETADIKDFDVHGKVIVTQKGKVMEATIPFNYLQQEGWGAKVSFKKDKIWQISWQTVGQPHASIMLKVWDIQLIE